MADGLSVTCLPITAPGQTVRYEFGFRPSNTPGSDFIYARSDTNSVFIHNLTPGSYDIVTRAVVGNEPSDISDDYIRATVTRLVLGSPHGFRSIRTTPTTALLTWQAVPTATGYTIRYRELGTSNYTTTAATSNEFTLTGLSETTSYEMSVRADFFDGTSTSYTSDIIVSTLAQFYGEVGALPVDPQTDAPIFTAEGAAVYRGDLYLIRAGNLYRIDVDNPSRFGGGYGLAGPLPVLSQAPTGTIYRGLIVVSDRMYTLAVHPSPSALPGAVYQIDPTNPSVPISTFTRGFELTTHGYASVGSSVYAIFSDLLYQYSSYPGGFSLYASILGVSNTNANYLATATDNKLYGFTNSRLYGPTNSRLVYTLDPSMRTDDPDRGNVVRASSLGRLPSYIYSDGLFEAMAADDALYFIGQDRERTKTVLYRVNRENPQQLASRVPTGLRAGAVTRNNIQLAWDRVSEADSYVIDYNGEQSTFTRNVGVITVSPGITYTIRVSTDISGLSAPIQVTSSGAALSIPTGLAAGMVTQTTIPLTWNAVAGATSYTVRYRLQGTTSYLTSTFTGNSGILRGLALGRTYEIGVSASIAAGPENYSRDITVSTSAVPIPVPTGLSAGTVTSRTVQLTWGAVAGADSYNVQVQSFGTIITWTFDTNSGLISNLNPNQAYNVRVRAVVRGAPSVYSTDITVTTLSE